MLGFSAAGGSRFATLHCGLPIVIGFVRERGAALGHGLARLGDLVDSLDEARRRQGPEAGVDVGVPNGAPGNGDNGLAGQAQAAAARPAPFEQADQVCRRPALKVAENSVN